MEWERKNAFEIRFVLPKLTFTREMAGEETRNRIRDRFGTVCDAMTHLERELSIIHHSLACVNHSIHMETPISDSVQEVIGEGRMETAMAAAEEMVEAWRESRPRQGWRSH